MDDFNVHFMVKNIRLFKGMLENLGEVDVKVMS